MKENSYNVPRDSHPEESGPLLSRLTSASSLPIRFLDNLDTLQSALRLWSAEHKVEAADFSEVELYLKWVQSQPSLLEGCAEDSEERVWAENDLYRGLGLLWEVAFDGLALQQLRTLRQAGQVAVIRRLFELASGDIRLEENCVGVAIKPIIALFSVIETLNITLLLASPDKARELLVIDILGEDAQNVFRNYLKRNLGDFSQVREFDQMRFYQKVSVYIGPKIGPRALGSVHSGSELTHASREVLHFLTHDSNCKGFVHSLKKMSTLKLKLTPEQEELIGTPENVLAIGRSGTGKTTCSLLRIFATEMLHKLKVKRERANIASLPFTISDVNRPSELHNMFVTVSEYLTEEVKDMYLRLRELVKQELRIREAQRSGTEPLPHQYSILNVNFSTVSMDVRKPLNLHELGDADFPVFATFDQVLKGVDGTLQVPFFVRQPGTNAPIVVDQRSGIHQKVKGSYVVEGLGSPRPSFLVDYEYFRYNFWPRVRKISGDLDPAHVWFEIMAIIKGSGTAYCFTDFHMSKVLYLSHGKNKSILAEEARQRVWSIFEEYIRWKEAQGAYDAQDIVNYVLYAIERQGYHAVSIHCMMIDEVQDLTPAMLLLLWRITEHQLFLSGDTAQTITKGAGFRFKDMSTISHYDSKFEDRPPKRMPLKTSFRSHMQILDLANHIVNLIELIFPKLIDKLDSEESPRTGPLPVFVLGKPWLQEAFASNAVGIPEITFGSSQVIIVRDEEMVKQVPRKLKQAQCLSVLGCKGLEFGDVMIYDFFSTSPVQTKEWESVKLLITNLFDRLNKSVDKVALRRFLEKHPISLHYTLCNDLKMLYVAVTRTRERLLFYESQPERVEGLIHLWAKLRLIRIAKSESEVLNFLRSTTQASASAWLEQAEAHMRHGNYSEAAKCYRHADKPKEAFSALTMSMATDGSNALNQSVAAMDSTSNVEELSLLQSEKESALTTLYIAAVRFRLLGAYRQAGQCYFSARFYNLAAKMFQECCDYSENAECYVQQDLYQRAAFCYELCRDYEKAVCCYEVIADWSSALSCIQMYADIIPKGDLESYVYHCFTKYCQSAIEESLPLHLLSASNESLGVNISESALGQSLYDKTMQCPIIQQCISSRAARKSQAVLSALWTPAFERAFSIEVLTLLELLEALCLPKLACMLAKQYRLPSVWQYCAAGYAHSLSQRSRWEARQLEESKCCRNVQVFASRAIGELEGELFTNSCLQSPGTTLHKALLALGFLSTLRELEGRDRLISHSLGMCALENSSVGDLFASISARQVKHPICTALSAWDKQETYETQNLFVANRRFWSYVTRYQHHEDFVGLIAYIDSTLPVAIRSNILTDVADCCSTIPLLLCWKENPERWSKLSIPSFHRVLKLTRFLIKAAIGHGSTRKKCTMQTWMAVVDSALAPFQVYRLPSSELTNCLPTLTHYAISRHSHLLPRLVETCASLPYYDIAGEWFLVRLEVAANALAVHITKALSSFLKERHSHLEKITERSDLLQLLLDPCDLRRYRTLALRVGKCANLYGEVSCVFSIQQLLPSAFPLVKERRIIALATIQELYSKLMYLQGLVDEDEFDKKFISFMKKKNQIEIKQLEEKLKKMRTEEFEDFCYLLVHYRREILFFFNWNVEEYPLTKCAREALLLDACDDFTSRPADPGTVLGCDRIFQVCKSRNHLLWMVREMIPDSLHLLYPLEQLQQGQIYEVAKWHLKIVDLLKDTTDELRNVLSHLSQGFLLGWLLCKPRVQCSYSLCQQLNTISCDERGHPCENPSLHCSTMTNPSKSSVEGPSVVNYERTRFSGFRDEEGGVECLSKSLRLLRKCLKVWLSKSGRLEGLLKHTVWKLIYFTLSNTQLESAKLNEMISIHVRAKNIAMKEYVDFVKSPNRMELVNRVILNKSKETEKKERIVTILMSEHQRSSLVPQSPREDPMITALLRSLRLVSPHQYSLRKVLYASSLGIDGLLIDESVDCLSFQQFALELVLTLRHECANQRDAQVVLKTMAEVQAIWTGACSDLTGNRLNQDQFETASRSLDQKKKEMEEWKKVPGQLPPWEDKRHLLPKKIL